MNTDSLIEALERELAGYIRRGLDQRAESVRAELRRLGRSPGATPREDVPVEPAETPATRVRKPVERVSDAKGTKTPAKPKRGAK